jgi:hypothetical protein
MCPAASKATAACEELESLGSNRQRARTQAALGIAQCTAQNFANLSIAQRLQHQHARARQQRAIHLKGRVLGGRTNQDDRAVLDRGQERILLTFVEAMDLVDEENRALAAQLTVLARRIEDLAQAWHTFTNCTERLKAALRALGDQTRQRGFARTRRPPQDHGACTPLFDGAPQRLVGTQEMCLPNVLLQRPRAHARRQRGCQVGLTRKQAINHAA